MESAEVVTWLGVGPQTDTMPPCTRVNATWETRRHNNALPSPQGGRDWAATKSNVPGYHHA